MTNNEFKQESNTVEYKKTLPKDKNKWLKSVVSFSNTAGGELFIGIEDSTLKVFGINEERSIFEQKIMETIYNNIEPKPSVDIIFKNINEKDIVIIQVAKGNQQPYYLIKKGIEDGCYIRYGSTDQRATHSQRIELMLNRKKESFTSMLYDEEGKLLKLSDVDIENFLLNLNKRIKTGKNININKLFEWKLIRNNFNETYVTNGLVLLLNNKFNNSHIRIGYFSGITKSNLLNEINIEGSIITQYEEVMNLLQENLKTSLSIGVFREQQYKIPIVAVREIIANAIIHRNYLENEPIRISLFDDRIEVFSPGTFFDGVQLEDVLNGISKLRNPNISEIFYNVGIIEKWGSGITRANDALEKEMMQSLIFEVSSAQGINVVIKFGKDIKKEVQTAIVSEEDFLLQKMTFTRRELEEDLKLSQDQARYLIEKWTSKGKITKHSGGPTTMYKVNN